MDEKKNRKKSFRVSKTKSRVEVNHKWSIFVIILSFILSFMFSAITSTAMNDLEVIWAFIVLIIIILINILFDIIGTSVAVAEEVPFHALSARKAPGALKSIMIIRHAPQVSNLCNDVIGDIAGIISGAATSLIVVKIMGSLGWEGMMPSLLLTGIVGALTIGGKALGKGFAMKNCNQIVYTMGKIIDIKSWFRKRT